jgi:spermidine/putrescine transport system permease protein
MKRERLQRPISPGLRLVSYAVMAFLYIPILVIFIFSFKNSKYGVDFQLAKPLFKWYGTLLENDQILSAAENTIIVGVISTFISTILGSLLGYGLHRYKFPGSRLFAWLMYIPVVTPDIVMAISLLLMYAALRNFLPIFAPSLFTMIIAHITFQISFVAIVVRSRLAGLDNALEEAARDLYANAWQAIRFIVLPLATPGILAGALLAFTLSIDDFVISYFTSGPTSGTLPIWIYTTVKRGITPDINALSTIIVLLTMIAVAASNLLQRNSKE